MDSILLYLNLEYRMSEIQDLSSQTDLSINLSKLSSRLVNQLVTFLCLNLRNIPSHCFANSMDGGNDYDFLLTFGDVKEAEEVVGDSGSGDVSDIIQVPSTLRSTIHTLVSNTEAGGLFLPDYPER